MEDPLLLLGRALRQAGYSFVTPTPETIRRVNARPGNETAHDLRGVFGWSRPFAEGVVPRELLALLERAEALEDLSRGARFRSRVRFSSLEGQLFVHSAWPTVAADSVFFGPDTYRFASLLARSVVRAGRVADVGAGSGAGGILLAGRARRVVLSDINPLALRYARVNAALAGVERQVEIVESDVLRAVEGPLDLVVANPPYLADERGRTYRDGGGPQGIDLSVRIAREALARLSPGGRLLLYTASPVTEGRDPLREALEPLLAGADADYRELDPDVFGEELERPAYAAADRIAVVVLDARMR